jgi:YHS domain-containing protein
MPVDPVCGIEMDEKLALIHEHNGQKYYFCCNGCKKIFVKKPKKYKKNLLDRKRTTHSAKF